ncbi:hypothetical protein AC578_10573 [Pseudocercospora eumusae]|uniref:Uncharacterized protein n=1 Tax=Pseudocercospora eumusae TaxID=321146 RepID=A0A139H5I0_9PEZI|nr:hypothetical protein AC578_10573 [Pseudocercospora eumusae]
MDNDNDYESDSSSTDRTPRLPSITNERIAAVSALLSAEKAEDEDKSEGRREHAAPSLLRPPVLAGINTTSHPTEDPVAEDEGKRQDSREVSPPSPLRAATLAEVNFASDQIEDSKPEDALACNIEDSKEVALPSLPRTAAPNESRIAPNQIEDPKAENEDKAEGSKDDNAPPSPTESNLPTSEINIASDHIEDPKAEDKDKAECDKGDNASPSPTESKLLTPEINTTPTQSEEDPAPESLEKSGKPNPKAREITTTPNQIEEDPALESLENSVSPNPKAWKNTTATTCPPRTFLAVILFWLYIIFSEFHPLITTYLPTHPTPNPQIPPHRKLLHPPKIPLPGEEILDGAYSWNPCVSGITLYGGYPCEPSEQVVEAMEFSFQEARREVSSSCSIEHFTFSDLRDLLRIMEERRGDVECHKGIEVAMEWVQRAEALELEIMRPGEEGVVGGLG